jgi:type VI secretion system protein ImpA
MSVIEVDNLLEEVSLESPCGEDLEYDPDFLEFERKIPGSPEQVIGDSLIPAELPDGDGLRAEGIRLFCRRKDLRLAVHLTEILLNRSGLDGLREGLQLIEELLRRYGHCPHPQLESNSWRYR